MKPYLTLVLAAVAVILAPAPAMAASFSPSDWLLAAFGFGLLILWGLFWMWVAAKIHRWAKKRGFDAPIH